jgi:hypothetical protein
LGARARPWPREEGGGREGERRKKGKGKKKRGKRKKGRKRKKRKKKEGKEKKNGKREERNWEKFRKLETVVRKIGEGFLWCFMIFRASA